MSSKGGFVEVSAKKTAASESSSSSSSSNQFGISATAFGTWREVFNAAQSRAEESIKDGISPPIKIYVYNDADVKKLLFQGKRRKRTSLECAG